MPDSFENNGLKAADSEALAGLPDVVDLSTPLKIPQFERIRKSLQADYTKKTQELAVQKRQYDELSQQAHLSQQQAQTLIQQHSAQAPAQAQAQVQAEPVPQSLADELESQSGTELDAPTRNLLAVIEARTQGPLKESREQYAALSQQVAQLAQIATRNQKLMRTVVQRPEIDSIAEKYGRENLEPLMPEVAKIMEALPELTFEQAVAAANPGMVAETARKEVMADVQAKAKVQEQQISGVMGELYGIEREPAGPVNDETPFDPKESFQASVEAGMGKPAFRELVVQDALRGAGIGTETAPAAEPAGLTQAEITAAFPQV